MRDSLDRSILRVVSTIFVFQILLFVGFSTTGGFTLRYAAGFLAVSLGFHLFLILMLRIFKPDFAIAETGAPLDRVNLANVITIFRVSSLPTLAFLIVASRNYPIRIPLLVLMAVVFASDFIDGWVSRTTSQVTRIGKMLDSASDYSVLFVLTIVFFSFDFIDLWFFVLVVGRLAEQAIFMAVIFALRGRIKPRTTFLGKATVASIMVLYSGLLLELILPLGLATPLRYLEWLVAAIVGLGIVDKVIALVHDLRVDGPGSAREPS